MHMCEDFHFRAIDRFSHTKEKQKLKLNAQNKETLMPYSCGGLWEWITKAK
jgi:hypothetical protein